MSPQTHKSGIQETALTSERIANIVNDRYRMLQHIEHDIDASLYDAIVKKIEYEHAYLLETSEASMREHNETARLNKTLSSHYFIQKTFDIDTL
ncbi:MAG TPA: hypothetical protein VJH91_03565 [Candidatus Paceibacterota bacterium]